MKVLETRRGGPPWLPPEWRTQPSLDAGSTLGRTHGGPPLHCSFRCVADETGEELIVITSETLDRPEQLRPSSS